MRFAMILAVVVFAEVALGVVLAEEVAPVANDCTKAWM